MVRIDNIDDILSKISYGVDERHNLHQWKHYNIQSFLWGTCLIFQRWMRCRNGYDNEDFMHELIEFSSLCCSDVCAKGE